MEYIQGEVRIYTAQRTPKDEPLYLCCGDHLTSLHDEVLFPFAFKTADTGVPVPQSGHDCYRTRDPAKMVAHVRQHIRQYADLVDRLQAARDQLSQEL